MSRAEIQRKAVKFWHGGFLAASAGLPITECPTRDLTFRVAWARGYYEARKEAAA